MGSRSRSIRLRIYFLVAVPLVTMVGLLGYVSYSTVTNAINIDRAPNLIHATSEPAAVFIALLQSERRAAVVYLFDPTPANRTAYQDAIVTTNAGISVFKQKMTSGGTLGSATQQDITLINQIVGGVTAPAGTPGALATLRTGVLARMSAPGRPMTAVDALNLYNQGSATMVKLFVTEAQSVTDTTMATQALGLINTVAARDFLSQEDALLAGMLAAGRVPPPARAAFSQLAGMRAAYMLNATTLLSTQNNTVFNQFLRLDGPQQSQLAGIEDAVAAGAAVRELPVTSASWQALTTKLLDDNFHGGTLTAENELVEGTNTAHNAWWRFGISTGAGLIGLILTIILTSMSGRTIIRRLRGLESSALTLAENQLPDVISRLRRGDDVDVALEAPPLRVGGDEIGRVGQAFDLVRQTAIRAAVEEAKLRRGLNDVFRSLARRSQSLLHRQLTLLDQMERRATDPEALDDLFRLDHLTTRMRRHAEGLVILAGAPAGRGWSSPVRMVDVMRGAIAEVEDYARVSVVSRSQAALAGSAVADVIHLLAELIENATTLSPPYTTVRVAGETVANGFVIEVEDRGLGMSQHRLAELNERLANPPEFNPSDSEQLGLFVVSQLAKRHGVKVTLKASPYGGTEAVVLVPRQLVVADEAFRASLPGGPTQVLDGQLEDSNGSHPLRAAELTAGPPFGAAPVPDSMPLVTDQGQFTSAPRISGPMRRSRSDYADSLPHGSHHAPPKDRTGTSNGSSAGGNGNGNGGFASSGPFPGPSFAPEPPLQPLAPLRPPTPMRPVAPLQPAAPAEPAAPLQPGELPRRSRGQTPGPAQVTSRPAAAQPFDVFRPAHRAETEPTGPAEEVAEPDGPVVQASPPYGEPADGFGQSDGDFKGLPKRVKQASLAPQLRSDPAFKARQADASAGRGAGSAAAGGPSPEEIRATMSALQRGFQEGRSQSAAGAEPPWQIATEGGADGS